MPRMFMALAALVIAACAKSDRSAGWTGSVDTLASGTLVVKNPETALWDSASEWRMEEDLRIGSAEGSGPDTFGSIADIAVDSAGHIYVLDRQAKNVRVFNAAGAHVRTIGKEGAGPGEFRDPIAMDLDSAGRLWVVDPGNARYTVIKNGEFVTSHHRPIASYSLPWAGGFDSQGRFYDVAFHISGASRGTLSLVRFTSSLQLGDTIPLPTGGPKPATLKLGEHSMALVPFTPRLAWLFDPRGYIWFGLGDSYRIHQRALTGDTVRIIEREHQRLPVAAEDRAEAREQLAWFVKQGGKIDDSDFPALKPVFDQLLLDDTGNLWVGVTEPHGIPGSVYDVFDPEGRYLGRVRSTAEIASYPSARITGDAMYAASSGEMDEPQIVRMRIVKPKPGGR